MNQGNRQIQRNVKQYNLEMIIAIGYRVRSTRGTQFRRWATERLNAFLNFNEREILTNSGKISHAVAKALAEKEYEKFNKNRLDNIGKNDFDRYLEENERMIRDNSI